MRRERLVATIGFIAFALALIASLFNLDYPLLALLLIAAAALLVALVFGVKRKGSLAIYLDEISWAGKTMVSAPLFVVMAIVAGVLAAVSGAPLSGPGSETTKTVSTIIAFALLAAVWIGIARSADNSRERLAAKALRAVDRQGFADTISAGPTLAYFWSPQSPPGPQEVTILSRYSNQLQMVAINAAVEAELKDNFFISSLPTIILFIDGRPVERVMGLDNYSRLDKLIDNHRNEIKTD